MSGKKKPGPTAWVDPDDAPELTAEFFERAEVRDGDKVIRRGRPPVPEPRQQVSIRFPAATLAKLRARGPGWQKFVIETVEKALT